MQVVLLDVRRPLRAAGLVMALLLCLPSGAPADGSVSGDSSGAAAVVAFDEVVVRRGDHGPAVERVQRQLHVRPVDGIFGRLTERAVKRFQRRHRIAADGIVGPETRRALGLAPFSASAVASERRLPRVLRRIAECESGGDPRAVSPDGRYRGKYQFSRATWRKLGGKGDPAKAPESEQDRLALKLYRESGTAPWANCA